MVCVWLEDDSDLLKCTPQYSRFGMVFNLEFFNDKYTCVGEIFNLGKGSFVKGGEFVKDFFLGGGRGGSDQLKRRNHVRTTIRCL